MISNLVTFGDSWPAGAELTNKNQAFGYLLAKMLNAPVYENYAISASSNDRMIFQLQKYIQTHTAVTDHVALFFITSVTRQLHFDSKSAIREIRVPPDLKTEADPYVANWFKHYHTDELDKFNLYKVLLSLQRICEQYSIQDYYVSGWTDINFAMPGVDTTKIFPTTCVEMFDIRNGIEFYDFNNQNQYIYPNANHPNPRGHAVIAGQLGPWIQTSLII